MAGNPRIQVVVCKGTFERAHQRARELDITTSTWLRRLIRGWDGDTSIIQSKQLSVRLDPFHLDRLDGLATRSRVSRSRAFALLVESALVDSSEPQAESRPSIPADDDYETWAALVIQAAIDTPQKFGRKAFISGVLKELQERLHPAEPVQFRAMVKRILLMLNRLNLVVLVRADLVPVMNPEWVAASEIKYSVATFHFVDLRKHFPESWEQ